MKAYVCYTFIENGRYGCGRTTATFAGSKPTFEELKECEKDIISLIKYDGIVILNVIPLAEEESEVI